MNIYFKPIIPKLFLKVKKTELKQVHCNLIFYKFKLKNIVDKSDCAVSKFDKHNLQH